MELLEREKLDEAASLSVIKSNMEVLLKGLEDKPSLDSFDLVLFPIVENCHYYLVCFDLQNPAIEVVDNMDDSISFVRLEDDTDYNSKSTVLKVVRSYR